ncbi:phage baseplate upper protein [Mesobacillus subterraneus]|uniref:BppU family phage baseplate upper protein n=1 Tax=Mesobacillus subterraneus TaxID=285983 RepID=UPI00203E900C|nr:BppU family phage baseplate upper protein [Mesobacillus subterraneus]MCM3573275.1 phage baseplate upper protein [Mesobacillus subterraneus]
MEVAKKLSITLDLKQTTMIPLPQFIQNDTNILELKIKFNGVDADLSNITRIVVNYKRPDKKVISRLLTATGNTIVYEIGLEEMEVPGLGEMEIQFFENDQRISTKRFKVNMLPSIGTDTIYENTEQLTVLQELFVEVETVKVETETARVNAEAAATAANTAATNAQQVADENKTRFLPAVATVADRDTAYPTPAHGDTVRVTGEARTYRFVEGSGWVLTDEYNPTAIDEVNVKLAETANKKTNVFNKKTYGTFETAAVLSSMANEGENPKPQVLGFLSTQQASTYSDRDSVSFYNSNRGAKPTVVVNSGTITYTSNTVQVSGTTVVNLDKILPGMLIDTFHTPNRWTSIVDSVDIATQTITVKDGWYMVQTGGSPTPTIPPNGTGFDVNRITKIWGINNNVFLPVSGDTLKGVAEEIGLFNYKTDGKLNGIDIVNFAGKSDFGFQVRRIGEDTNEFTYGYLVESGTPNGVGFFYNTGKGLALASSVSGDTQDKGFTMDYRGQINKLRLHATVVPNGTLSTTDPRLKVFVLSKSVLEGFELPSPVDRSGESIFVLNQGSAKANLTAKSGSSFLTFASTVTTLGLLPKTSCHLISDGSNWVVVHGSFDNNGGYVKQTGSSTINGNLSLDNGATTSLEMGSQSVASSAFMDFHSSGVVNDYDARFIVTGGDATNGNGDVNLASKTFKFKAQQVVTVKTGAGQPVGAVTPDFIGQDYIDTANKAAYKACGTSTNDWKQTTI